MDQASNLRKMVNKQLSETKEKKNMKAPKVISITSGKGGVGKTNVVSNLAILLAQKKKKVLIIDADLGLANVNIIFGLKAKYTIRDVIKGEQTIKDVVLETKHNIKIIPAGSGFEDITSLDNNDKLKMMAKFDDFDEQFDFVLIDTSAGISSNVMYFNLIADHSIVVATPEPTSLADALALMKVMSVTYNKKDFFMLLNMINYNADSERKSQINEIEKRAKGVFFAMHSTISNNLKEQIVLKYLGALPYNEELRESVKKRIPFLEKNPKRSLLKEKLEDVANKILDFEYQENPGGNLNFFFKKILND